MAAMTNRNVYTGSAVIDGAAPVPVSVWTLDTPGALAVLDQTNALIVRIDSAVVTLETGGLVITGNGPAGPVTVAAAETQRQIAIYTRKTAVQGGAQIVKTGTVTVTDQAVEIRATSGESHVFPGATFTAEGSGFVVTPWNYPTVPAVTVSRAKGCGCNR